MSFETKASRVSNLNHKKVICGLESMLKKHEEAEMKKMRGLSEEMISKMKSKKSP